MNLFELCRASREPKLGVPRWTLGCYRRRSITYYGGQVDTETEVLWLQSLGLTADLRLSPGRPRVKAAEELLRCSVNELVALAEVEGGLSPTRFEPVKPGELAGSMQWLGWNAFQLHAKWPEPGQLRRVGDCLIEFAPSGAYVEDWRLQPSAPGPLIGLWLIDERDVEQGTVLHRGGGLVLCGDHAAFVRGRAATLPKAERLDELLRVHGRDPAIIQAVFGFDASYAQRDAAGHYTVTASTLPWREGEPLLSLEGFTLNPDGLVVQRTRDAGRAIERRFTIDTLEPDFTPSLETPASEAAKTWLTSEASTLLRGR